MNSKISFKKYPKKQSDEIDENDMFKLVDLYFSQKNILFRHLYNSFDNLIDNDIKSFLENGNNTFYEQTCETNVYRYKFEFDNIKVESPIFEDEYLYPVTARNRNLTYNIKLSATITQIQEIENMITGDIVKNQIGNEENDYPLCKIPVMVGSKYCNTIRRPEKNKYGSKIDPGGYFIVGGSEKIMVGRERIIENRPLVFLKKESNTEIHYVQLNSVSHTSYEMNQMFDIRIKNNKTMVLKVPLFKEIPVLVIFKAIGITLKKDIINICSSGNPTDSMTHLIKISLKDCVNNNKEPILTQDDAIQFLLTKMRVIRRYSSTNSEIRNKQQIMHLMHLLKNNFIPHIEKSLPAKAHYLGYMINRLLLCYLGERKLDDRDSFINKRVDLPGSLIFELFKQFYKKMLNDCKNHFKKTNISNDDPINIINQIKPNIIELGIKTTLVTGNWNKKKGVAQMLPRQSFITTLASLRRLNSPTSNSSVKLVGPRHLHSSSVSAICIVETPEGENIGNQKHLSMIGSITVMMKTQISLIKKLLKGKVADILNVPYNELGNYARIFLNGEPCGLTDKPREICDYLHDKKIDGTLEKTVSISFVIESPDLMPEILIYCDGGRLITPKLCVNEKTQKLNLTKSHINMINLSGEKSDTFINTWDEFLVKNKNIVEYVDTDELYTVMVAITPERIDDVRETMTKSITRMNGITIKHNSDIINRYDDDFLFVRYSYCELHPSLLLGVVASNIPFCNHNQGPRNIYQYSQARHAKGEYIDNWKHRFDTASYILYHPQNPFVITRSAKYIRTNELPAGENTIVAICCYTGYNMEDSIIMNQTAIDRGLFNSTNLEKHSAEIQKNHQTSEDDMFVKPDIKSVIGAREGMYDKINYKGIAPEETPINYGDIIIAKVSPLGNRISNGKMYRDRSVIYKKSKIPGVVDKVMPKAYNTDGYEIKKVRTRSLRVPKIGDKFCCYTENHEILTKDGWIPVNKINFGHKIATLDDGSLVYSSPTHIQEYKYEGPLFVVNSNGVKLSVTPNHRMYVKSLNNPNDPDNDEYKIITAEKCFGSNLEFLKSVDDYDFEKFPQSFFVADSDIIFKITDHDDESHGSYFDLKMWIKIFAIVVTNKIRINSEESKIIIRNLSSANIETIIDVCQRCFVTFHIASDLEVHITDKMIVRHFSDYMFRRLSENYYLEDWCWSLPMTYSKLLVEHLTIDSYPKFKGKDKYSHDDFQRLCLHAGVSSTIIEENGKYTSVIEENTEIIVDKTEHYWNDNFEGKVYCCTVPGEGIIYVRNKLGNSDENNISTPIWCGNSKHGQKGTIGITLSASDMPFTENGIQPDIIMNPHAIPSRMTIGQLIECLSGKAGSIIGHKIDGTPFMDPDIETIKDALESYGYDREGTEHLFNGMTGELLRAKIFIGPTYYQRLKHMVDDKIHSRARGPCTVLTMQPPVGRARDGGLRVGNMEKDALIGHGISSFLKERFMETSDIYDVHVCNKCGLFAQRKMTRNNNPYKKDTDIYECKACRNKTDISQVQIPYSFKLLLQELLAINIAPRIKVKSDF